MIVASKKESGGIKVPAITISVWHPESNKGWKTAPRTDLNIIEAQCSKKPITDCIIEKTFNQTDVIKDVILGSSRKKSFMNQAEHWTEDLTFAGNGRFYTLNIPGR